MKHIKPWYQRWFGGFLPSANTLEKAGSGFWYVITLLFFAAMGVVYIFAIGYVVALAIEYPTPVHGGIVALGIKIIVGSRSE